MTGRVVAEPALVLLSRPYRESSAIVQLLTLHHGRVAVVARGVRAGRRGNALQPFNRLSVNWTGRGSLHTLTGFELDRALWLQGNALASGFYLLELISRLLGEHESVPEVFVAATASLETLQTARPPLDPILRTFEKLLLEELGYGLDFSRDADTGRAIEPDRFYALVHETGFVEAPENSGDGYPGSALLAIERGDFADRPARAAARAIFRSALAPLLGPRPLTSRTLLSRHPAA